MEKEEQTEISLDDRVSKVHVEASQCEVSRKCTNSEILVKERERKRETEGRGEDIV